MKLLDRDSFRKLILLITLVAMLVAATLTAAQAAPVPAPVPPYNFVQYVSKIVDIPNSWVSKYKLPFNWQSLVRISLGRDIEKFGTPFKVFTSKGTFIGWRVRVYWLSSVAKMWNLVPAVPYNVCNANIGYLYFCKNQVY